MIGCEERLLPIDSADSLRIEEERRLFYVAATRAKDRLTLTTVAERLGTPIRGPSRFLAEAGDICASGAMMSDERRREPRKGAWPTSQAPSAFDGTTEKRACGTQVSGAYARSIAIIVVLATGCSKIVDGGDRGNRQRR